MYMQMKYLILLSLITYTYACPVKTDAEWKALGCVVQNAAGTDASGLGIVEPNNQLNFGSCSISCTAGVWVITQTCATGFEESNCEICPVCVASSADNTGLTCAEYKEQWLQNKCCSAHNPATCDPISQGYEARGCGTCS